MSVVTNVKSLSIEEYLDGEERCEVRHEYINGVIYAMVGASIGHNLLSGTLFSMLHQHLRATPCLVFQSDMKVRLDQVFYYPDIVVSCDEPNFDKHYLTNPILIVEVLSPSTEAKDRLEKRVAYSRLPSVQEYILISQEKLHIEVFRRNSDEWLLETYSHGDTVNMASVAFSTPIERIYQDLIGHTI